MFFTAVLPLPALIVYSSQILLFNSGGDTDMAKTKRGVDADESGTTDSEISGDVDTGSEDALMSELPDERDSANIKKTRNSPKTTPPKKVLIADLKRSPTTLPFKAFWETFEPFVRAICHGKNLRSQEVEDVVAEIKHDVLLQIKRYEEDKGKFHSWLGKITHNKAATKIRNRIQNEKRVVSYGLDPDVVCCPKRPNKDKNTDTHATDTSKTKSDTTKPVERPVSDSAVARLRGGKGAKSATPATDVCVREELEIAKSVLERVAARVSPIQYQIFDSSFLRKMDVAKVCKSLGITPNKVSIARHRVGKVYNEELDAMGRELGRDLDRFRTQEFERPKAAAKKKVKSSK